MNAVILILLFVIQLMFFFLMGVVTWKILGIQMRSLTMTLLIGFLVEFIVFQFVALPITIQCQPLSLLSGIWMGLICMCEIIVLFTCGKWIVSNARMIIKKYSLVDIFLFAVIIGMQMFMVYSHIDGYADASYYIGKVSTDVYTNTIGQYEPYTGYALSYLDSRRVLSCFPTYNSVMAQFFDITPIQQAKLIMPEIIILMANIVYYQLGMSLFEKNKRYSVVFTGFVFVINFFSCSSYTTSAFLFTRTYEGKAILGNIIIPGILLGFILIWKEKEQFLGIVLTILFSWASCVFSSSSMLVVPIELTAGLIPWIFGQKKWSYIKWYMICIIPNMVICIVYFLAEKGIVTYPIS